MEIRYKLSENEVCCPSLIDVGPICYSLLKVSVSPRNHSSEELLYRVSGLEVYKNTVEIQ